MRVTLLDLIARQVTVEQRSQLGGIDINVVGMRQRTKRHDAELVTRKTRNPAERIIHLQKMTAHVDQRHANRRIGEGVLEGVDHKPQQFSPVCAELPSKGGSEVGLAQL